METVEYSPLSKMGNYCAKASFGLGTILFISYCATKASGLMMVGLIYLLAAIVINVTVLFILTIGLIFIDKERIVIVKAIGLVCCNIPIAAFYFYFIFEFISKI